MEWVFFGLGCVLILGVLVERHMRWRFPRKAEPSQPAQVPLKENVSLINIDVGGIHITPTPSQVRRIEATSTDLEAVERKKASSDR